MSEVYVRDFSLCFPNVKVKPEADSGFKKGGPIYWMQPCRHIVFEVGGRGVARTCMSTFSHSHRDSVILETIKYLSFDGHLEKNWSIFLVNKCKQRCFGSSSTICFSTGHGAQRCRGNWSKTGTNLIIMSPYRYLLPPAT